MKEGGWIAWRLVDKRNGTRGLQTDQGLVGNREKVQPSLHRTCVYSGRGSGHGDQSGPNGHCCYANTTLCFLVTMESPTQCYTARRSSDEPRELASSKHPSIQSKEFVTVALG